MKKFFIFITFLFSGVLALQAQQQAEYTQYMFNNLAFNPAYAGSRGTLSAVAIYRMQWVGIDGAPRSFSINGHDLLGEKHGVGLHIENDKIGVHNRLSLFGNYAFHIPLNQAVHLSIGTTAGVFNYRSNWSEQPPKDVNDPIIAENTNKWMPNFGLGAHLYSEKYYVGLSVPRLLSNKLNDVTSGNLTLESKEYLHAWLTAGYVFDISDNVRFKPSTLVKVAKNAPVEADINASFLFNNAFWAGITYRTGDSVDLLLEYNFKNGLRIGYAYDLTTTKLSGYNSGSHEIMLGYDLTHKPKAGDENKVLSPRFF